jgi:hypothetical protein
VDKLRQHLDSQPSRLIPREELSEVLLLCHNFLKWAVRDRCDTLVLRPQEAIWCRDGREVDRFSFARVKLSRSLPVVMARLLAHDAVVRQHLTLVSDDPEETVYRLG